MTITTAQFKSPRGKRHGYTLVEVIISLSLLTLVVSMGLSAVTFIGQSSTSLTNYSLMSNKSRLALEIIASDLRMGYKIDSASTSKLDFHIYGKEGTTSNLVYEYVANENKLYRTEDGNAKTEVLDDLTNFQFNYFNLRKESTTAPISIKEVQIEGLMKKKALVLTNTNYIISARFMMRNRSVSN